MKVHFDKVFELDDGFQENLISQNNFYTAKYLEVFTTKESVGGVVYTDIYTLSPLGYFEIKIKDNIPKKLLRSFILNTHLLESGVALAGISVQNRSIYIHNCTQNKVYLKSDAIIGEVEEND